MTTPTRARHPLGPLAALLLLGFFAGLTVACGGGGGGPPTAPRVPITEPPPPPPPPPTEPMVLGTATLRGVNGHRTEGTAQLVRLGETYTLNLANDFRTNSQVITVRLCRNANCSGDFLDLGALQSLRGAQSYAVPAAGTGFPFVIIWCVPFRVPIGVGELQ